MKVFLYCLYFCALLVFSSTSSSAQSVPIESDAIISDRVTKKQINALVALVQLYGYRCDSVSSVVPFVWSYGFNVVCNRFRYDYDVEDKGGTWVVTLD